MSDHVTPSEQSAEFTPYAIPAPEDEALSTGGQAADAAAAGDKSPPSESTSAATTGHRRSPEGAAGSLTPVSRADGALDEVVALAQILAAPLDPTQALGQALVVGMRLLGEARILAVYAVEAAASNGGALQQFAVVERREAGESPMLDLERRAGVSLGLGADAESALVREWRMVERSDVTALPLRTVSPGAPALAGVLLVRWEATGVRGNGAQQGLTLLASTCAVLLDRREQSLAHDAFLSLTVHELRSPLTAVKGYAQLLLRQARRLGVPPQMHQAIDAIEEQSTRMADMISEMHDAVRIRRGDLELHPERVDIRPLVEAAVQQQRRLYPQYTITLAAPDVPLVATVDSQRLTQVVAALVNNAARYSPNGSAVVVRVSRTGTGTDQHGAALVCVQDAGIGIATTDRVPIFEYLYRAPEAMRRHLSGLGLGLFVSRSLVERMGGQLWLDQSMSSAASEPSEHPLESSGSTFCFTVPLVDGELNQTNSHCWN